MTLEEQLELISYLAQKAQQTHLQAQPKSKWREIRGLVKESALGENAQDWISRSRQEADALRKV